MSTIELDMDLRELKGLELAARAKVEWTGEYWSVPSQGTGGTYRVTLTPESCECDDFSLRQSPCKHIIAARLVCERDFGGKAPAIDTDTIPKRPTYRQNWPAYGRAQATEKRRFQVLLADLCRNLADPDTSHKRGPKPHRVSDAVFTMVFKVYVGFSSRRFSTDLLEAHEQGFISKPIPGAKVTAFHENEDFTPILTDLIAKSAAPLAVVESDFAVDSSGFGSSRYERWYDQKYGVTRNKAVWVKAHIACGVKTNCVTAVRILEKDSGDCPQLVPLVKTTRESFTVREFSADKAYASNENFEGVHDAGGTLYAAFKSNATGGVGGLFEKMFHYFQFQREDYLKHYHKRSNVESVFSAVKRKFGDSVLSKTDTAMKNEVLCKLLAHNLCVLIQEQEELGIAPVFWKNEDDAERNVIPFRATQLRQPV